jgi:hypothetical protein
MTYGDYYNNNLSKINQTGEQYRKLDPNYWDVTGAVGGAAPAMMMGGPAAEIAGPLVRTLAGVGGGALNGALYGASNSPDLGSWDKTTQSMKNPAMVGALLGGVIPNVARAVGGLYKYLVPNTGIQDKTASGILPSYISKDVKNQVVSGSKGLDPKDLNMKLEELGPEASPMDLSEEFRGQGQNLAGQPGVPSKTISDFLDQRAQGTNARIQRDLTDNLGSQNDTMRQQVQSLIDKTSDFGEHELDPVIKGYNNQLDAKPIVDWIDQRSQNATGDVKAKLDSLRKDLVTPGDPGIPPLVTPPSGAPGNKAIIQRTPAVSPTPPSTMVSADKLNQFRQRLGKANVWGDDELNIKSGAQARSDSDIQNLYGMTKDVLKTIPGYEDALDKISPLYKQREALQYGFDSLNKDMSTSADDFTQKFGSMSSEEQNAVREGQKFHLNQTIANSPNDVSALSKKLGTPDDNNYQKLSTVFGKDAIDNVNKGISRENTFADTAKLTGYAKATRINNAANNAEETLNPKPKPFINVPDPEKMTVAGTFGLTPVVKAINSIADSVRSKPPVLQNQSQLARLLTNPDQTRYLVNRGVNVGNRLDQMDKSARSLRQFTSNSLSTSIPPLVYLLNQGKYPQDQGNQ